MDRVIRDFAPLDALIQIAGRCNRHQRLGDHGGEVEIVSLVNAKGRAYADLIYDRVLLDMTRELLSEQPERLSEADVLSLSQRYFQLIRARKDTGAQLTETFARWGELPNIQQLLRGEQVEQTAFLVLAEDENWLRLDLESALTIADRWERRQALRALAGDLQQRSVSVYAKPGFHPQDYAESIGPFWILDPQYYAADSGLELGLDQEAPATCIL
jgi:CRISPR-associated endonuclease/helicase Cas3